MHSCIAQTTVIAWHCHLSHHVCVQRGEEDVNIKHIITEAVQTLSEQYTAMFKPSTRCRPPHLHADTLREDLYTVR